MSAGVIHLYNNTIRSCATNGIRTTGTGKASNNAIFDNADDFEVITVTGTLNASDDINGPGTDIDISPGGTEADDWNDAFIDYPNGNFQMKNPDSVLFQAGESNSNDSEVPTDDIVGNARTDGSESIGAWEIAGAAVVATRAGLPPAMLEEMLTLHG